MSPIRIVKSINRFYHPAPIPFVLPLQRKPDRVLSQRLRNAFQNLHSRELRSRQHHVVVVVVIAAASTTHTDLLQFA